MWIQPALLLILIATGAADAQPWGDPGGPDLPGVPPATDVDAFRPGASTRPPKPPRPLGRPRGGKFRLLEASIADIHTAFQRRELTCDQLVRLYLRRIKHYSGHCVKYDVDGDGVSPDYDFFMPSGKGIYLGVVSTIPNAGKINAIQSLNLRPANYRRARLRPAA